MRVLAACVLDTKLVKCGSHYLCVVLIVFNVCSCLFLTLLSEYSRSSTLNRKFDKTELVADPGKEPVYMARQHHDFQREGSTVGYYYPNGEPKTDSGNTA